MSAFVAVSAPISIKDMPPCGSWISPSFLGVTTEDAVAIEAGTMTPERQLEIYEAGQRANDALVKMPVPGVQE
jgi:hypothetical protein